MTSNTPKVVSLGGGCGVTQILLGLSQYTTTLTGIIAVTDTGRSTGKVRSLANIPAPGDIRNALASLAGEECVTPSRGNRPLVFSSSARVPSEMLSTWI